MVTNETDMIIKAVKLSIVENVLMPSEVNQMVIDAVMALERSEIEPYFTSDNYQNTQDYETRPDCCQRQRRTRRYPDY